MVLSKKEQDSLEREGIGSRIRNNLQPIVALISWLEMLSTEKDTDEHMQLLTFCKSYFDQVEISLDVLCEVARIKERGDISIELEKLKPLIETASRCIAQNGKLSEVFSGEQYQTVVRTILKALDTPV